MMREHCIFSCIGRRIVRLEHRDFSEKNLPHFASINFISVLVKWGWGVYINNHYGIQSFHLTLGNYVTYTMLHDTRIHTY